MSQVLININNTTTLDTCNKYCKVADNQNIKCQQPTAQRIMGCNTSRHRVETSTRILDPATNMPIVSASRVPSTNNRNVLRVRKKYTRRVQNVRSAQKSTASIKMTAAFSGSVSDLSGSCTPAEKLFPPFTPSVPLYYAAGERTDVTQYCNPSGKLVGVDDVDKAAPSSCGTLHCSDVAEGAHSVADSGIPTSAPDSTQRSSCSRATREPVVASKTTKSTSIKIATTKTHTAPLTVARLPRTHTTRRTARTARAARAASAANQLTKSKKITANATTTTTAITNNERMLITVAGTARETEALAAYSDDTRRTKSPVRLTSPTTATAIATATQVAGALTAVDVKSKFTENKCPLSVPTNVSNQRKVEANSTISAPNTNNVNLSRAYSSSISSRRTNEAPSSKLPEVLCAVDVVEHEPSRTTITRDDTIKNKSTLNLAARKAKLKSEFFRDFESTEEVTKRLIHSSTLIKVCDVNLPKRIWYNDLVHSDDTHNTSYQPISWSATVLPTISIKTADTTSAISLVARRKLDLKRKFEQQSSGWRTFPNCDQQLLVSEVGVFSSVEKLVQKFDSQRIGSTRKMIVSPHNSGEVTDTNMLSLKPEEIEQRNSPLSDEGCNFGQSPYSSDNEENESTHPTSTAVVATKHKEKVARSASSDSALGLDVDESMDTTPAQPPTGAQQRRMTLTVTDLPLRPALLPLAEPTALPDSPTIDIQQQTIITLPVQTSVPTKVLLEERVVELPEDPRSLAPSQPCSRRESAQSCSSDTTPTEFPGGRRFVRTPSVVVSDYSDDVMCGITLEEIEYFRAQRMKRRHSSLDTANEGEGESDVSAASSCSNLYYCGSTISALDGNECYVNGIRTSLDRKVSDCSTCSVSADEESFTIPEDPPQQTGKDLADLLAAQHLNAKPTPKKVGLMVPMTENLLNEKITN